MNGGEREHRVSVFEGEFGFLVRPACVVATRGERVVVINHTGLSMQVLIPHGYPMAVFAMDDGRIRLEIDGEAPRGPYPYQVFLEGERRRVFARGESAPHILIDP